MTKQELVISALEEMGLKPQIDDDGDILVRYQLKRFYVLGTRAEDSNELMVLYNQFFDVEEGEEIKMLTACNILTRTLTVTKVYIERTLKDVSASYEFAYFDESAIRPTLEKAFASLALVRPALRQQLDELSED